jgi:transcription elongation factor Elf1
MKKLFAECPKCRKNELFITEYNCLKNSKNVKNWMVCKNCDYTIQIEKLKSNLCCV